MFDKIPIKIKSLETSLLIYLMKMTNTAHLGLSEKVGA
jgi:hypothetical protein